MKKYLLLIPILAFAVIVLAQAPEPECPQGQSYVGNYVEPYTEWGECEVPVCEEWTAWHCPAGTIAWNNKCYKGWSQVSKVRECLSWAECEWELGDYWEGSCVVTPEPTATPSPSPTMPPEPTGTPVPSPTPVVDPEPIPEPEAPMCTDSGMPVCKRMGTCNCLGLFGKFLTACEYYQNKLGSNQSNANQMCLGLTNYGGNRNFLDRCLDYWNNK